MRAFLDSGLHANYFYRGIIYHPECGVRRFRVKLGNRWLALAISLFSFAAFSLASAQTPPAHKPRPRRSSSTLEGQWSGSLQAGEAMLHLVLHVTKAEDGSLKATIDSLDQGVYGIEVTSFAQKSAILRFSVASVSASYEGKLAADQRRIDGDWMQGSVSLPLIFHRQSPGAGAKKPSDAVASAEGVWQVALEGNGMRMRLQLRFSHDYRKQLVAALDSPDMGVSGLPAVKVSQKDASFHFEIPVVRGVYDGTLDPGNTAINGSWTKTGREQTLNLQRSDKRIEVIRPKNKLTP